MNDEYPDLSFARHEGYPDERPTGVTTGRYRSPAGGWHSAAPLDDGWDPVEELTFLLQDPAAAEQAGAVPPPRSQPSPDTDFTSDSMDNLARLTGELPPLRTRSVGHRKVRVRKRRFSWLQTVSFMIAAFTAAIVAMVSVFGGMIAYAPLQRIASGTQAGMLPWWPLLVYGPWTVASLSILRTALHRRRAVHSWFVVLLFSSLAVTLCVVDAERTFTGVAAAALPALACLACFQQLVRQITLTRPPRQGISRHRQRTASRRPESPAARSEPATSKSRRV
ncbi:DUF2637 domain-containing protein [Streptomyces actuosus]|uniref:DUF2637 domain-containing protein n=1 Tax=Streptomyces actuosus TaxID=1885 RepID=A0ABS2W181_STRAS|nr:DUF2637 domain-containing protein [Streptomyces actuosus]MBN0049172.1 DUF2637 domain-containing protein [Streptomyces actuosus]